VIAVDTNVLIYANREESASHTAALEALRLLAEGDEAWAIPVFCIGEFLRVVSHNRLFDPPTPVLHAMDSLESLRSASSTGRRRCSPKIATSPDFGS
jgi:predicted nucleic acid-binding protein